MSLINKEISDFSVQAYQAGEFKTVTKADVLGKGALFFFNPADFTFVCPTELRSLQRTMKASRRRAARSTPSPAIPTSSTRHGTTSPSASRRSPTRCSLTRHTSLQRTSRS